MRERKLNRLNVWNYNSSGYYYVTINTKRSIHFFGHIQNGKIKLSEIGRIAHQCWIKLSDHFNYISLDKFIIMPNHFHGIIKILPFHGYEPPTHGFNTPSERSNSPTQCLNVYGTGMPVPYDKNKPQYKKLPIIIGSYKSAASKLAHKKGYENFGWHKSYYDHIVRNEDDLNRIRKYIFNNPANWDGDRNRNIRQ